MSFDLQKAVFTAINNTYPVYDIKPAGSVFPYITLGLEQDLNPNYTVKNEDSRTHIITLHLWSKSSSREQIKTMEQFVKDQLTSESFTVQGCSVDNVEVSIKLSSQRDIEDPTILHSVVEFNFQLTKK